MIFNHDIVTIGASAGGVEALKQLVKTLPADLSAALFVVVHFPSYSTSVLPQILNHRGKLRASHIQDGETIVSGRIYVVPPDFHGILKPGMIHLDHGPRENGHRPAIDTLFRSAAQAYGPRVVGVVLSGTLDDGSAGLAVIKSHGGVAIVQDPDEALFNGMPLSALQRVEVDHVLKIADIGTLLIELANRPLPEEPMTELINQEAEIVAQDKASRERGEKPDGTSPLTCPDCGGVLWELQQGNLIRYRCHVGHAYSIDSLVEEQASDVERALWSAVRALEEKAALARRMAIQAEQQHRLMSQKQFLQRAEEAESHADLVQQMILQQTSQQASQQSSQQSSEQTSPPPKPQDDGRQALDQPAQDPD